MEDDKKKRRNKKKKNKQNQQQQQQVKVAADDTSSNAGETSSQDQNYVEENNLLNQASGIVTGGLDTGLNTVVEGKSGRSNSNGTLDSYSADTEKQKWLQEEVRLRDMVKRLLYEKDSLVQNQADLELRLTQLQVENDFWSQKEVSLEQRISELVREKADANLEEGILKEKVRRIEKEKFLLVENENSNKELIATLTDKNTRLSMQVLEMEGAQSSLSQDNRQLLDKISTLESTVHDLEKSLRSAISAAVGQKGGSEEEDLNAQVEAAFTLIEKLVTENAELVEKLNELYMELERRRVVPDVTSVDMPDYAAVSEPVSGSGGDFPLTSESSEHFETVVMGNERVVNGDLDSEYASVDRHSSETAVSEEIVQIPLDENEIQDLEAQASPAEMNDGVPITDAPLIGAPFRLISFFAKYVSGADLLDSSSPGSH